MPAFRCCFELASMAQNRRRKPRVLALLCLSLALVSTSSFQLSGVIRVGGGRLVPPRKGDTEINSPRWSSILYMSSATRVTPLSVSLDQPLLPDFNLFTAVPRSPSPIKQLQHFVLKPAVALTQTFLLTMKALLGNKIVRVTVAAFAVAFVVSLLATRTEFGSVLEAQWTKLQRRFRKAPQAGIPMPFNESENEGWGVCSLRSKRKLGKTTFVQYDFDLPEPDYVLPLDLGQAITMCCLDYDNNVAKGDFFPLSKSKTGGFSIITPNHNSTETIALAGEEEAANFVRILKHDLRVGDEVALKPGPKRLKYRGVHLPVTDMVYVASGVGIVPILDQVQAILPDGSSSVTTVTILWINENSSDFDVILDTLEKAYAKYSAKLAVSCVVLESVESKDSFATNPEVHGIVPRFKPGTMAVLSGSRGAMKCAHDYLEKELGYPTDTICVL